MAKTIEGYEIQGPTLSQRVDITCKHVLSRIRTADDVFFGPLHINDAALTDGELQRLAAEFEMTARYFHSYAELFRDELLHRTSRGTRPPRFMPGTKNAW